MADISRWNLSEIKHDLFRAQTECFNRGLRQSAKWLSELAFTLRDVQVSGELKLCTDEDRDERYRLVKAYFDLQEYDRAAHFAKDATCERTRFLYLYSTYLSGEKKKLDDMVEPVTAPEEVKNKYLKTLRSDLEKDYKRGDLDGYCMYLYGVVLKRLNLEKLALKVLVESVYKEPLHWGAWLELASLITDNDVLRNLDLPGHWMKQFFLGHTYLELQMNDEAFDIYNEFRENGFSSSTYVMAQVAITYHNMRLVDEAIDGFRTVLEADPYRLDNLDVFSNLLYVKELRAELSHLAHHICEIDKYRVETCCVIGNFYSLRSQHEKAVLYFQRALRLNPNYLSAWTLMGHEYMEMKNSNAAIQAYRQAIEVNRRDYRAWYGLGQTYEILKMPSYSLYYYRRAQQLRPYDSRMIVALGEAYEKLEKYEEAKKCYWKARSVGDIEGLALNKLAKVYEKLGEEEQAKAAFTDYLQDVELRAVSDKEDQSHAHLFLADYYLKRRSLEEAYDHAQKCTEHAETREAGKAILKEVSSLMSVSEPKTMSISVDNESLLDAEPANNVEPDESVDRIVTPLNWAFTP